ncbi:hypothetical protein CF326_g9488 [Tilletia indica]|nr:hypothetical protein CF326_g9488 [Tilletia indica]
MSNGGGHVDVDHASHFCGTILWSRTGYAPTEHEHDRDQEDESAGNWGRPLRSQSQLQSPGMRRRERCFTDGSFDLGPEPHQTDSYEWSSTILDVRRLRGSTTGHVSFFSRSLTCRALDRLIRFRHPEAHRWWITSWVLWEYDLEEGADISKAGLRIDLSADQ